MSGFLDHFAVKGLTTIADKILESSNNLKTIENYTHDIQITKNFQSIIMVSSVLFGSIYLYSVSLQGINAMLIHEKKENHRFWLPFLGLNGSIMVGSSLAFISCARYLLAESK